ncbi:hypothetical protein [Flagellimonas sp.]|jgi:uncharacterized protein YlxP (DUF503 family)|uniref:hypothetical protein n=1 Tax=Flagellimonas sp. TaxID=2058762 RepID=UPI000B70775F|nr:MAG: nuclear transport factor 2 family protein [Muricauda sp. TMED12]|tara:strand:- start:29859 stop:30338 length:480 start_codon:yes stop_codon:yes gene_type:complete
MRISYILTLLSVLLIGCGKGVKLDLDREGDKIMRLHRLQRKYHFTKDSVAFAKMHSPDFTSVNKGVVSKPILEDLITKYHHYFSMVEFLKWDDKTKPVVMISNDGTQAYTIVEKIVKFRYEDSKGDMKVIESHFAWTTIYKKYNGQWKIDCVTSTEKKS